MKRTVNFRITGTFFFLALFLMAPIPSLSAQDACVTCHSQLTDPYQKKVYSVWESSVHHELAQGCVSCHGGDNQMKQKEAAHKSLRDISGSTVSAVCGDCHTEVFEHFVKSNHFKKAGKEKAPTCVTCHSPKSGFIVSVEQFDNLCSSCHAPRGEAAEMTIVKAKRLYSFYLKDLKVQFDHAAGIFASRTGKKANPLAQDLQTLAEDYKRGASASWHAFQLEGFEKQLKKAYYLSQEAETLLKEEK